MRVEIDTHTHTLASGHAYNTLNEMAQAAADKGLKGLAITEHAPEMSGTCHLFYFQNLRIVPRKKYGIELLLGTELNIMNAQGEIDLPDSVLERLDIAIASIHMPCFKDERTIDNVTAAYEKVMEHPYVDIIGHPDDGRFPVDMKRLVKKAKETGTLLEVNNSSLRPEGFRENTKENCLEMVKECKAQGVMIVLGSDSHVDADIAEYPYVEEILRETDFPEELVANVSLEKLSYQFADWNRGQAENRMNRLISQYGTEIELVLSNNDEMALGAVEAYRKVGYIRKDWPVIFGIDGLEDALEAVKAGEMQGSIYNDRVDQAKEMAKMAVTLFEGKDLDQESLKDGRYYFSEYKKVDGSNIEEYLTAEEEEADGKNMEP